MKKRNLGIYIHIPFCVKKCNYCDFLSFSTTEEQMHKYMMALINQIKLAGKTYKDKYIVDSIFFGGGTPTRMPAKSICKILKNLFESFDVSSDSEISIECNPGTCDKKYFEELRKVGFNRISIGVQSFNDEELKLLGRIHDSLTAVNAIRDAESVGFENINVDLMSGIPGQSFQSFEKSLNLACDLGVRHISSYSLIIEEGTPFYLKYADNPPVDEDTDREIYAFTKKYLADRGYERYEISNYSKPGYECKHNLKYWSLDDYLGLGLGASSKINNCRFKVTDSFEEYLGFFGGEESITLCTDDSITESQGKYFDASLTEAQDKHTDASIAKMKDERTGNIFSDIEMLDREDEMAEFMFLGLRKCKGVSKEKFYNLFGMNIREKYGEILDKYISMGYMVENNDVVKLTDEGIDVSNIIFVEFI